MLKCTPSWSKDRKLLSALTAVALDVLILELRDVTYYIHQWIVKQLVFCAADGSDRLISHLTSLLAIASPSPSCSFSSPLSLPRSGSDHRIHQDAQTVLAKSKASCFAGQQAGFMLCDWLLQPVLSCTSLNQTIESFPSLLQLVEALHYHFISRYIWGRGAIEVAKATCKLFKILPNSSPLILSAFFFLFSTSLFLYSSIL